MKVLHLEFGRYLYGGALQVFYLLRGLQARGVENVLVCDRGSEIGRQARVIAPVREIRMAGELDPRIFFQLGTIIRRERPDIVHVHSRRGADLWGGLAAMAQRTPAIITRRVDNPEPVWLARGKYGMYRQVVTISEGIRDVLLREGIPEEKVICIHSAVDHEKYRVPHDRDWFRREFGFHPQEKVIGTIAQMIPRKGHRYLIEAAPEILAACPTARFLFLGQGPARTEIESLCRQAGLQDKVVFAGFREDLPRILPCLELVVHPALMEGLGVSLLQAAAAGIPMVATRAGGIPEIVRDGENGWLVDGGQPGPLGTRIIEILRDSSLARRFGENGRRIVEEEFSIERMVAGNAAVYASLLAKA